jgi:ribosomal-protein-alanine N-acetyltransferase
MTPADLPEVLSIERASFPAPWTEDMFLREIANRTSRALVFKAGEKIVGYLCFWEVMDEAHVLTIAVRPQERGKGYGLAIMAHLEAMCLRDGLKKIILEVGRRNMPARGLYKKCGFNAIGFRRAYYAETKDDALVMERWLKSDEEQSLSLSDSDAQ